MPPIVAYSTAYDVKENLRWTAYLVVNGSYFGVRFNGPTEEEVRATAEKFWIEESARQGKIRGGPKPAPEQKPAPKQAVRKPAADFEDLI